MNPCRLAIASLSPIANRTIIGDMLQRDCWLQRWVVVGETASYSGQPARTQCGLSSFLSEPGGLD
jgi:hypothetical protein